MCCAFLWKNKTSSASGARVSWASICKPKKEGGLGLRRLEEFEQVFALKRVWNLFSGAGSLWVAWLQSNVFTRRCYWSISDSQRLSPTVRSMIRIKGMVAEFLCCSIGDGRASSFWFDYWTDMGPLIEGFGPHGPRELLISFEDKVVAATENGEWALPPARSQQAETLQIVLSTMNPPRSSRGEDRFLWRNGEGRFVPKFSTKATWQAIRETAPTVQWYSMVWFKEEIPRCSFITWMAVLSRLPTKDRLASWGLAIPLQCVLCSAGQESHDHLFFQCSFVRDIWAHYCGSSIHVPPLSLQAVAGIVSSHQVVSSPGLPSVLKLLQQCIIYCVWRERNMRIFQQSSTSEAGVFARVDRLMRDRLISIPPSSPSSPSPLLVYFRLPPPVP
uniref:Reverse transcriptase zinc-binding domain-containing protein n=1 Tax=Brassica oleracea var. oleracea TaxID=109376 RepID=A0A0D3BYW5_BRAOL